MASKKTHNVENDLPRLSYHDPWRGQHKLMPLATFNQQLDWADNEAMVYLAGWGH